MSAKLPQWSKLLAASSWVNQVAISDDGRRVIGATFIHDYQTKARGPNRPGIYGASAYDVAGNLLWNNSFSGWDGVFAVDISGDGKTAAGGGWASPGRGLLQVYNAVTGGVKLDVTTIPARVNCVSLSRDGGVLAAAADTVYLYAKDAGDIYQPQNNLPLNAQINQFFGGFVSAVAVHPDGTWLAACGKDGTVLVATIANGGIAAIFTQVLKESLHPGVPTAELKPVPLLSVAIAEQSGDFIVAGGNSVFQSSLAGMMAGIMPLRYEASDAAAPRSQTTIIENVRWAATTADGSFFATVANRRTGSARSGVVLAFNKGATDAAWKLPLSRNPNGISMDHAGQYVAIAVGYPVGTAAAFFLFDKSGNKLWDFGTSNMNWPVAVSPDASAIVAGGDDGVLYYFLP
jgi:WD40 repeat protein